MHKNFLLSLLVYMGNGVVGVCAFFLPLQLPYLLTTKNIQKEFYFFLHFFLLLVDMNNFFRQKSSKSV